MSQSRMCNEYSLVLKAISTPVIKPVHGACRHLAKILSQPRPQPQVNSTDLGLALK